MYELTTEEYSKLLIENISKTYKKTSICAMNAINTEVKALRKILTWMIELSNTIRINLFFTLKDRKENFQNNPKRRLTNPEKSEIWINQTLH